MSEVTRILEQIRDGDERAADHADSSDDYVAGTISS